MQMVKNIFITLIVIWFAILVFMPKKEMYYKLEEELAKQDIKINEKSIDEGLFTLTIKDADIYTKGIKLAKVEKLSFFTLLLYTKVELENLLLDDSLKAMAPTKTQEAYVEHAIWNPLYVKVEAEGSFGVLEGNAALGNRVLRLNFSDSKGIEMIQTHLQEDEKGWYYETSF